jgi:hypothetical protein
VHFEGFLQIIDGILHQAGIDYLKDIGEHHKYRSQDKLPAVADNIFFQINKDFNLGFPRKMIR